MRFAEFFQQLESFSVRYFRTLGLKGSSSPWHGRSFRRRDPQGVVLHYTADESMERVLRWFMVERYQARSSANWVIAMTKLPGTADLCHDLPLVAELPVTVVQCVPPDQIAWHATWVNAGNLGVELLNIGEVRWRDGQYVSWRPRDKSSPDWTTVWEPDETFGCSLYGRRWARYPAGQLSALIMLLRYAQEYHGTFRLPWVVGHDQVQGVATPGAGGHDKRDPGPHFPIWDVRESLLRREHPERMDWMSRYAGDPCYGVTQRDGFALEWAQSMWPREELGGYDVDSAWSHFTAAARELPAVATEDFWGTGKLCLKMLGYPVSDATIELLQSTDVESLRIFQRLMGLVEDGEPGPLTRMSLLERLEDRGILERGMVA